MTKPTVLFVCVHNAGRSQMAAGFLAHLAGDRIDVRSAGSAPGSSINPVAVEAMAEVGIDIAGAQPRLLTTDAVEAADAVITMGCGDACPYYPGKRYEDWVLEDPAGQGIDVVRRVRDEIRARVKGLVASLLDSPRLEPMLPDHGSAVLAIYGEGIAGGNATFESAPPTWQALDAALLPEHRFVAVLGEDVVGWVGVSPTSRRAVYAGVLEHSVYVADAAQGRGVGSRLLGGVIASTEAAGAWMLQAAIFPENTVSLRLHERHGFRRVGTRSRIGRATVGPWAGTWRDTVLLERRSERVGMDG